MNTVYLCEHISYDFPTHSAQNKDDLNYSENTALALQRAE